MVSARGAASLVLIGAAAASFAARESKKPLGGLSELYDWPEDPKNLVANPSFEEKDESGKLLGWRLGEPAHWTPDPSAAHSRDVSLLLKDSHKAKYTPIATQRVTLASGWYSLRGFVKTENAGTKTKGSGGRISLWKGKSGEATRVVPGTTEWSPIGRANILFEERSQASIRLEAYRKPDGKIFFDDVALHRLIPPRVEGFLLYPNYRGTLFQDRSQTIQLSVRSHSETAAELVRVSLEDLSGSVLAKVEQTVAAGDRSVITLDAGKAPLGRLRLRLQALEGSGNAVLYEYPSYELVKISADARSSLATYVDGDNALVVDGKRQFVLGIYDTSGRSLAPSFYAKRISKIAEGPFNFYLNYWLGGASKGEIEALTTVLRRFGMSYLHTVNAWYEKTPNWPKGASCDGVPSGKLGQTAFTTCKARELSEVSGLAGWYTADEVPADSTQRVFEQYRLLRDADPDGVTFIAQNRPREIARWRDAADVMGVDPYPIFNIPEGRLAPLENVTRWVDSANEGVERSRPVWAVIQFFQHGGKGHWPTYDELRTMSYMAVISGAKGLFYWSYGARGLSWVKDPEAKKTYWERLLRVVEEIHELEPVLLAPDDEGAVESVSDQGVRFLAKELDGSRYVFAVNDTRSPLEAEFRLSEDASRAEVIQEQRTVVIADRKFVDSFRPYEAHAYRIGETRSGSADAGPGRR